MSNETFEVNNFTIIKEQLLIWASQFSSCSFLDNNQYQSQWKQQECLVAAGVLHEINVAPGNALPQLQQFLDDHKGEWIFGHLSYDLNAEIEPAPIVANDPVAFAGLSFFVPQTVFRLTDKLLSIFSNEKPPADIWKDVCGTDRSLKPATTIVVLEARTKMQEYLEIIGKLKEHIHRGDCYEINFCQEFYAENILVDSVYLFKKLSSLSPNPFACYYKIKQSHLVCASPERYISRNGNRLFSQPIKGTASRNLENVFDDRNRVLQLQNSPKERSENVMVVDLVRNDLSRICREGTVKVDELFGIYTYPHVHQMISTVSGETKPGTTFTDIIKATFPMGSMTGAPKKKVMELISKYESGSRGLFSGAVGYISPEGNFDFNVVIRSLLYNSQTEYLSYWVGGGITWYSNAADEYDECMLKAIAIKKVLQEATP
ncbi:anthranilate synthase component I family protein [soil metagenome]